MQLLVAGGTTQLLRLTFMLYSHGSWLLLFGARGLGKDYT